MEKLDTPLTRLQAKHEKEIQAKDVEIAVLKLERAKLRGVNDILRFELADLQTILEGMQATMETVMGHVRVLKANLPDINQ